MKEKHYGFRKRDVINDLEVPWMFSLWMCFRVSILKGRQTGIKELCHCNHVAVTNIEVRVREGHCIIPCALQCSKLCGPPAEPRERQHWLLPYLVYPQEGNSLGLSIRVGLEANFVRPTHYCWFRQHLQRTTMREHSLFLKYIMYVYTVPPPNHCYFDNQIWDQWLLHSEK